MSRRRATRVALATALVATGVLVAGAAPAGAATFGPVDHTITDGDPGSLRDIVENQATNPGALNCVPNGTTCGDVVLLEAG